MKKKTHKKRVRLQLKEQRLSGLMIMSEKKRRELSERMSKMRGESSGMWKGGCSGTIRLQALKRDNYTCQNCKLRDPEIMEVDHTESRTFYPELSNNVENLTTLCPNCHKRKTVNDLILKDILRNQGIHIFLDGPDGCSKTTIAKMLKKHLKFPIIKMPKIKRKEFSKIEEFSYIFNRTISQMYRYHFIVDRGFTSSLVYSKVFNRPDPLHYISGINKMLKPLIVILTATNKELFKRRPIDRIIDKNPRIRIKNEYDKLAKKLRFPLIDTTNKTEKETFQDVLTVINGRYGTKF